MVRTRLATLTLAGGLLLTSSGCFGMFGGIRNWRNGASSDCNCHDVSAGHETVPITADGPVLVTPAPTFTAPPPAQVPGGPTPRIVPIPATPMPWAGQQ